MKAGLIFTGSGPILIVTSYPAFDDPGLVAKLKDKGIDKYAAFEVPVETCRRQYGARFVSVCQDLKEKNDLRVLDYSGEHAFYSFTWEEMQGPVKVYSRN